MTTLQKNADSIKTMSRVAVNCFGSKNNTKYPADLGLLQIK